MRVAAVDMGATSVRVAVVDLDAETPRIEVVHRWLHGPETRPDGSVRWRWTELLENVRLGLDRALETGPIASIGIDGWAVDYGLLDEQGQLLSDPHSYRDPRTDGWRDLARSLGEAELYRRTGVQLMPINTIFQLAVHDRGELDRAARFLMLPELVAYELTGEAVSERSNAGTTGLLDVATGAWASDLAEAIGVSPAILPKVESAGRLLGEHRGVPVHLVAAHDTACAVAASPLGPADRGFLSAGTWFLVGIERRGTRCVRDRSRGQLLERAWGSRRLSVSEKRAGLLAPGALRIRVGRHDRAGAPGACRGAGEHDRQASSTCARTASWRPFEHGGRGARPPPGLVGRRAAGCCGVVDRAVDRRGRRGGRGRAASRSSLSEASSRSSAAARPHLSSGVRSKTAAGVRLRRRTGRGDGARQRAPAGGVAAPVRDARRCSSLGRRRCHGRLDAGGHWAAERLA